MIDFYAAFQNPITEENKKRNAHNEHFNKNMYIVVFNKKCKRLSPSRYKDWKEIHSTFSVVLLGWFLF